jgi:hypothetical protein
MPDKPQLVKLTDIVNDDDNSLLGKFVQVDAVRVNEYHRRELNDQGLKYWGKIEKDGVNLEYFGTEEISNLDSGLDPCFKLAYHEKFLTSLQGYVEVSETTGMKCFKVIGIDIDGTGNEFYVYDD